MDYLVYCLQSETKPEKTYIGYTGNLERRLKEHNTSNKGYTKKFRPWKCVYKIENLSKTDAIKLERKIKRTTTKDLKGIERQTKIFKKLMRTRGSLKRKTNVLRNENCLVTMEKLDPIVDLILTSPPYNMTWRKGGPGDIYTQRYDGYDDWKTEAEYINWTVDIFDAFDKVLKERGVVLYNFSYSVENPALPYLVVAAICKKTRFTMVDTIIWKKQKSMPFTSSPNRLRRTTEFVFVFARKGETGTFNCNKKVTKVSTKGQNYYENKDNFIEAENNDGKTTMNKATYSSDLCRKLLNIYAKKGNVIYDPFMGTGTTALAAKQLGMKYIGSEISKAQVEYSNKRLRHFI